MGGACLERRVLLALERRTREQRGLRQRQVPESSPGADVGEASQSPGADVGKGEPSQSRRRCGQGGSNNNNTNDNDQNKKKVEPNTNANNDDRQLLITKPRE